MTKEEAKEEAKGNPIVNRSPSPTFTRWYYEATLRLSLSHKRKRDVVRPEQVTETCMRGASPSILLHKAKHSCGDLKIG
jgi:hypothetical protein